MGQNKDIRVGIVAGASRCHIAVNRSHETGGKWKGMHMGYGG